MLDLMSFAVLPGLILAAAALLAQYGGAIFVQLAPLAPYLATMIAAAVAWRFRQTKLVLTCGALLLGYSLLVRNSDVSKAYQVQGMPNTVIVDRKGKVRYILPPEVSDQLLTAGVRQLVAEKN